MSGVHDWDLKPKTDDTIIGGILDGSDGVNHYAIEGWNGYHVTLQDVEVRNYNQLWDQQAAINTNDRWILKNVQSHDNGRVGPTCCDGVAKDATGGGYGAALNTNVQVIGGRFYNNRQLGLGGGGASGTVLDGIELDHNDFTDDTYTHVNINCGYEGGGIKWAVATGFTVKNSKVHDNACAGLWSDVYNHDSVVTNNEVWGNGGTGIFIEISHGAKISGNNVHDNGFPKGPENGQPTHVCNYGPWENAGINISSSDNVEIWGNTVTNNCAGITGRQDLRGPDPALDNVFHYLDHLYVHDNVISGKGPSGTMESDGTNLATRDLVWANNQFLNGATFCGISC